jgi:hypothetical protein
MNQKLNKIILKSNLHVKRGLKFYLNYLMTCCKCHLNVMIFKKLLGPHKELEFVAWVEGVWNSDSKWGHIVPNDTPYALTRKKGELSKIFTTFRGALMEQGNLAPGEIINKDTVLAIMAVEGDVVAYGKPNSVFKQGT